MNDMPGTGVDLDLGEVRVRSSARTLESATATATLEPLMLQLLTLLAHRAGVLVSRQEIFDRCWGAAPVGDDSLNRVVAGLRKALKEVGAVGISIQTVAGAGYVLRLSATDPGAVNEAAAQAEARQAIAAAYDSWRLGLPQPDFLRIEQLRRACFVTPDDAHLWGMLALLTRLAAEYDVPANAANHLRECEHAARQALSIDSRQPETRTALVGVIPLFGGWSAARSRLEDIVRDHPDNMVASQDLSTLLMATGYLTVSKKRRDDLLARDPLAAVTSYKVVYQHWSIGDLANMDRFADRAIQLWPTHPAVWMVRFWTLAYTGKTAAALAMLNDGAVRPAVPPPLLAYLKQVLDAAMTGSTAHALRIVDASRHMAATGPANAVAAFFSLGLLRQPDALFDIADAYYVRAGSAPVPLRHTDADLSLNEQHRRLTQVMFTPVFRDIRSDRRFLRICEQTGLRRHWDEVGEEPDFLRRGTALFDQSGFAEG